LHLPLTAYPIPLRNLFCLLRLYFSSSCPFTKSHVAFLLFLVGTDSLL